MKEESDSKEIRNCILVQRDGEASSAKSEPKENEFWLDLYKTAARKDRVKWNSKVQRNSRKTLYEQTEEMMDVACSEFVEWMNDLSSEEKNRMDKESIKSLFSIGIEAKATNAVDVKIITQPTISPQVAELFHNPERSIDEEVKKLLAFDIQKSKKPKKYIAFGRILPPALRNLPVNVDRPSELDFPEDVRSGKTLFYGIEKLRSTKILMDHLNNNPSIKKPKYLREIESSRK